MSESTQKKEKPPVLELFLTFAKIGLFTFGGGYAMLPLIQDEVIAHGWMSNTEIMDFIAVSESTPGPFAVNISTYIGRTTAGILGAGCATLGVVLPSFIIMLVISGFYKKFSKSRLVEGAMSGLRPTVVGLIGAALLSLGRDVFVPAAGSPVSLVVISIGIFIVMAVLAFKRIHPIVIIGLSAVAGIITGYTLGL